MAATPPHFSPVLAVLARRVLAVLLVVAAMVWVLVNKPVEGPVLLVLTRHHGVTAADLLSAAALVAAAALWVLPSRRR